jgi:hypothetical protein
MKRNSPVVLITLLLVLMLQFGTASAGAEVQGEIKFAAEHSNPVWIGQEVELQLDLWSDGLNFGDQLFVLPEVKGGFLLQADSSTVSLSENRKGVQWQGLRYTFFFYPQRAGRLEVPVFDVRFSTRAAYNAEPVIFQFRTSPVFIDARLPPGADSSSLVVTSSSFTTEAAWTPGLPDDGPVEVKVGDAITLQITRRAQDVPAMVFAPLPEISIDGLGIYPDSPRVNDRISRGLLTGVRTDSITFICEREGIFKIPQLRFQWWDPAQEVLSEKIIPALELEVSANPAYAAGTAGASRSAGTGFKWKPVAAVIVGVLILVFPGRWLARDIGVLLGQRRAEREAGEPWAFQQVQKECASGSTVGAYNAITLWLSRLDQSSSGLTLMQMAVESDDEALLREVTVLQENLASGSQDKWSGGSLAHLLAPLRNRAGRVASDENSLLPLNPPPVKLR